MLEEQSEIRSEYCDGEIFAMAGGTLNHSAIVRNVLAELRQRLRGGSCRPYGSDLRLYVEQSRLFTYPDVLVLCGAPAWYRGRKDTVTDARVVFEVLSPSTERYDRGDKFRMYQDVPSLQEYILLAQDQVRIERGYKQSPDRWVLDTAPVENGELALLSLDIRIPIDELYLDVIEG